MDVILILGAGDRAKECCKKVLALGNNPYAPDIFYPLFLDMDSDEGKNTAREAVLDLITPANEVWVTTDEITEDMAEIIRKATKLWVPVKIMT